MDPSREDVGIVIRSAFLQKGTKQRFSLFALVVLSVLLLFIDKIDTKPLNYFRSIVKDTIYRGSVIVSLPTESMGSLAGKVRDHVNLYGEFAQLEEENKKLKNKISETDYLKLENTQLRKLISEKSGEISNLVSARVMLDKQSPYLNSFIINSGTNSKIKNGMAVLDGENFIGRIVDVNFFSSRVLFISDLNSKIPVVVEPTGHQAILSGHGKKNPTLEYLPEKHNVLDGNKVYTSGKEGIFSAGMPIGEAVIADGQIEVVLFSDLNQITFVNIKLGD